MEISYISAKNPLEITIHYAGGARQTMTEDMYADKVARIHVYDVAEEKSDQVSTNRANIDTRLFFALTVILTLFYGVHGSLIGLAIFCLFKALTSRNRKS